MAISNEQINAITHTARINMVLAANPKHPRKKEYAGVIADYKKLWSGMTETDRGEAAETAAEYVHDMTPEVVAAAVSTLEG